MIFLLAARSLFARSRSALLLPLLLLLPALTRPAAAKEMTVPGTTVTFDAPEGFTPLTASEIVGKFPPAKAPQFVVGNERRTTTVAYDLKPNRIPADRLGEVKDQFEKLFERVIPGLEWKERKLVEMAGQQWIFFEMTSKAIDTNIHNLMLVTPHAEKMLVFNFNSTKEEFPKLEAALRKSMASIRLR